MPVSNKIFNHIKVHTQYSICEGAIKIDELADYCKSKKLNRSVWLIVIICAVLSSFQKNYLKLVLIR